MKQDIPTYEGVFYDIYKTSNIFFSNSPKVSEFFKDKIFSIEFYISDQIIEHERSIYTFLDLIGNLGGVHDLIIFVVGIFISPFSEHSFKMKFLRKLYILRTTK